MQQKHSPLPWIIGKQGGAVVFVKATGEAVSDCRTFMGECDPREPQEQANAEFIVRACNNFEELLEACKRAVFVIESTPARGGYNSPVIESYIGQLKTAIAKAEKGK